MAGAAVIYNTYTITGYTADITTNVYPIKLSNSDLAAQPTADTGKATTAGLGRVKISRSSKSRGVRPRELILTRATGTAPNIRTFSKHFPVLLPADFNAAAGTITIGGVAWTIAGKQGESVR